MLVHHKCRWCRWLNSSSPHLSLPLSIFQHDEHTKLFGGQSDISDWAQTRQVLNLKFFTPIFSLSLLWLVIYANSSMLRWIMPFHTMTKFLEQIQKMKNSFRLAADCIEIWQWYPIHFRFHLIHSFFFQSTSIVTTLFTLLLIQCPNRTSCTPCCRHWSHHVVILCHWFYNYKLFCWHGNFGMFRVIVTSLFRVSLQIKLLDKMSMHFSVHSPLNILNFRLCFSIPPMVWTCNFIF